MHESGPVVVVGLDGSPSSKEALAWAAEQAARTQGRLEVVMCWRPPVNPGFAVDYSDVDFAQETAGQLDAVVVEVLGETPAAPVEKRVVEGHAAPVLVDAARTADLLVVGSRGHGAFAEMLVGSTSLYCVNHAACPVVVVRDRGRS